MSEFNDCDCDKGMASMVFEYVDSMRRVTRVEKTFEESWNMTPLDTLLTEIAQALKATGFSQVSIDECIIYPQ